MNLGTTTVSATYRYLLNQSGSSITLGDGQAVDWDAGNIVTKTGNQTITGNKTFKAAVTVEGNCSLGTNAFTINRFGVSGEENNFGNLALTNMFGQGAESNTFGDGAISSNSFGNGAIGSNYFGEGASTNDFGKNISTADPEDGGYYTYNSFGEGVSARNTFGYDAYINTFGNSATNNIFGQNANANSFGGSFNSFGFTANSNAFGQAATANTFGADTTGNTYGAGRFSGPIRLTLAAFSGSSNQAGQTGEARVSGSGLYICTGTNLWGRVFLSSF
jgi:hypothetical protein